MHVVYIVVDRHKSAVRRRVRMMLLTTSQNIREQIGPWFESWELPGHVDFDVFVDHMTSLVWDDISEYQEWVPGGYADLSALTLDFEAAAEDYFASVDT
jgi:hypothetical protein